MIHDIDLEFSLLKTALVLDSEIEWFRSQNLSPAFYSGENIKAYESILELSQLDPVIVEPRLKQKISLQNFQAIQDAKIIPVLRLNDSVTLLKEMAKRRQAIASLQSLEASFEEDEYLAAVGNVENFALSLSTQHYGPQKWYGRNGEFLNIHEFLDNPEEILRTGLSDLDQVVSLIGGTLNLFIARPGMGKSLLAMHFADEIAERGIPVLFVSLEMAPREIQIRRVSKRSAIDSQKILRRNLTDQERLSVCAHFEAMNKAPLHYDGNPLATVASIASSIKKVIAREDFIGLLIVDYLQLLSRDKSNKADDLDLITLELRALLREFNIPGIVLAQLNRGNESRGQKRPELADIRSSGAIEQHSDSVTGIYRDEYYNPDSPDRGLTELIVLKNRTGPTRTVKVCHDIKTGRYFNLAKV